MKRQRLWHVARDTGGQGEGLVNLLVDLEIFDSKELSKEQVRKGLISDNRHTIKDVLHRLNKGSHVIAVSGQAKVRITII